MSGQGVQFPSSHRPARLVVLALIFLTAVLALRVIAVAVINNGRLPDKKLEGIQIHGRYYPVEKVCLAVDDGVLEGGLKGSRLDRGRFSLLATGNTFEVSHEQLQVSETCGWTNWEYKTDPELKILFQAAVGANRIDDPVRCTTASGASSHVSLGRYVACRESSPTDLSFEVHDDNAWVRCSVMSNDAAMRPALERSIRQACEGFLDRLTQSRPITYWGSSFWTAR